ncbi:MAG: sensor histidine kinase [Ruminococcus sp.]|nr:sensor histidine kinase [Ruminococcus sp.]
MNKAADKLSVLLLCTAGFAFSDKPVVPVAGLILSVIMTSLVWLNEGTVRAAAVIAVSAVCCVPFPMILCASPLLLFDAMGEKKPWLAAPALLGLGGISELGYQQIVIIMVSLVVTVILRQRISSLEKSVENLSLLRDEVEEKNLLLNEKNLSLADAQDNEIYLATLRERNRIAREIHDNVGHMLTRSLLQAGALTVINKDERLKAPLNDLKDTLNTAMTSIRESVHDLHDESVDLDAAVRESIRSIGGRFKVSYDNDSEGELPAKLRLCFLAVIKEGLSNAVKHSNGDSISITVRQHPAFYQLTVEDNGRCSDTVPERTGGIGLQNMRDRAAALGGMISFTSSENGFRIFMTAPAEQN